MCATNADVAVVDDSGTIVTVDFKIVSSLEGRIKLFLRQNIPRRLIYISLVLLNAKGGDEGNFSYWWRV